MKTLSEQVRKLEFKLEGLQIEVDNLAEENGHFANFLERMNYTPCEIDNISNGWFTDRINDLDKNELMFDIMNDKGELIVVEDLETLLGMINRHMGHILKVKIHTTEDK